MGSPAPGPGRPSLSPTDDWLPALALPDAMLPNSKQPSSNHSTVAQAFKVKRAAAAQGFKEQHNIGSKQQQIKHSKSSGSQRPAAAAQWKKIRTKMKKVEERLLGLGTWVTCRWEERLLELGSSRW